MRSGKANGATAPRAQSALVDNRGRGAHIRRRLAAQGLNSDRSIQAAFEGERVVGRDTLAKIWDGTAAERSYTAVEAWLDRLEEENGDAPAQVAPESSLIRVRFKDVAASSIGEIIVEGPSDQSDELIATITRLLAEVRKGVDP
jgi:hypothetical protein